MERIALKFTNYIGKDGSRTELELKKVKYGTELILINLSKFMILMISSYFLNIIPYTLVIMISFGIMRKSAFGLHSKNSVMCTVISMTSFISGAYISKYYPFKSKTIIFIFLILISLLIKYSPADTEKRPLIGREFRNKLKRNAVITTILLFTTIFIINNQVISTLITLGVIMECIFILPITYKILGRKYKNYEQYK